jgi:hypothetical protein
MIEEATADAYDESEQATGWFTMFEEHRSGCLRHPLAAHLVARRGVQS